MEPLQSWLKNMGETPPLPSWLVLGFPIVWLSVYGGKLLLDSRGYVDHSRAGVRYRRALTEQVARQSDSRSIGALIDACGLEDQKTRKIAVEGLTSLLPRLTPDEATLLDPAHRLRLCSLLHRGSTRKKDLPLGFQPDDNQAIEFRLTVLQGLARWGGAEALPAVQLLAKTPPKIQGERRIQKAAIACLQILEQRSEQNHSSKTLLRASDASGADSVTLLRSVTGNPDENSGELLRANLTAMESREQK